MINYYYGNDDKLLLCNDQLLRRMSDDDSKDGTTVNPNSNPQALDSRYPNPNPPI